MANGSIITTKGRNVILHRSYTENGNLSATLYLAPTQMRVGISNSTPAIGDTDLDEPIPIANGTVNDDGDNQFAGTSGADNSTDNTDTYKEGASVTDAKSQNLIANDSNATKTWTIANLAANGSNITDTLYVSMWLSIKDATALAKFKSSSTAFQIKLRTNGDGATLFYTITKTRANLVVGWNFITNTNTILTGWTQGGGGPPSGVINEYIIEITTNNATDTFSAGDILCDLLRSWSRADALKTFVTSFPTFDYTNNEVTIKGRLTTVLANGFLINGLSLENEDTSPLMTDEDTMAGESKSLTDEFIFIIKNRIL